MAVECFRRCLSDCQCISFNYLTTVNQDNCELNEENKYLKPNALQAKPGIQYYDLVFDYNVVVSDKPLIADFLTSYFNLNFKSR